MRARAPEQESPSSGGREGPREVRRGGPSARGGARGGGRGEASVAWLAEGPGVPSQPVSHNPRGSSRLSVAATRRRRSAARPSVSFPRRRAL